MTDQMSHNPFLLSVLLFLLALNICNSQEATDYVRLDSNEILYVIEPFDEVHPDWVSAAQEQGLQLRPAQNSATGGGSIRVDYDLNGQGQETSAAFYWIEPQRAHNCLGATQLSIWYRYRQRNPFSGQEMLRVSLYDDSRCMAIMNDTSSCDDPRNLQIFDIADIELAKFSPSQIWHEVRTGLEIAPRLNLSRIRGWRIEFAVLPIEGSNNTSEAVNEIMIDQLALIGGGEMFGAAFQQGENTFYQSVEEGIWQPTYYKSELSQQQTTESLSKGVLNIEYLVEQTDSFGGYIQYVHTPPGNAYYDLSQATHLVLDYYINQASSAPNRATFRLILGDINSCTESCEEFNNQEQYLSFHSILDTPSSENIKSQLTISIENPSSSPWLDRLSGITGDSIFDITHVKSIAFQIGLDNALEIGSVASGAISLSSLAAITRVPIPEMSFVMQPFQSIRDDWLKYPISAADNIDLSIMSGSVFGDNSIRMDFSFMRQEIQSNTFEFGFGSIQQRHPHSCQGATHFSIWYKIPNEILFGGDSTSLSLRLTIYDDFACLDDLGVSDQCQDLNLSIPFVVIDHELNVESREWHEVTGLISNNAELTRLRAWKVEVIGDMASSQTISGAIIFDQLACVGSGKMLGAAFTSPGLTFAESISEGTWDRLQRFLSANETSVEVNRGTLDLSYRLEQIQNDTFGYLEYQHITPGNSYYNLSQATNLSITYTIPQVLTYSDQIKFGIVLYAQNDIDRTQIELHSPFYSIFDEVPGSQQLTIPVQSIDTSKIIGYGLRLQLDTHVAIGDVVTGSIALSDFRANFEENNITDISNEEEFCVVEEDLKINERSPQMNFFSFRGDACCDICKEDPECLYAIKAGIDCYTAPYLEFDNIGFINTFNDALIIDSFWMDDISKRGDFCDVCVCNESTRSIDCRNRDLAIVPKTFSATSWNPTSLDLRENPRLVLLGSGSLSAIENSLEELFLPDNVRHIPIGSLQNIQNLRQVYFGKDNEHNMQTTNQGVTVANNITLNSAIIGPFDLFGDICCGRGPSLSFPSSTMNNDLTFCDLQVQVPGIDSIYEPFKKYNNPEILQIISPFSHFMAEASESVEKCAEYCSITPACKYFQFDNRIVHAEPSCFFLESAEGGSTTACCEADDYADEEQTLPGWTNGAPPFTRNVERNAKVLLSSTDLVVNGENNYTTEFEVSLGSSPLRGAVWIEPTLITMNVNETEVMFSPSRVALYDSDMTATIKIQFLNVAKTLSPFTVVIDPQVTSCDVAFVATDISTIFVQVFPSRPALLTQKSYTTLIVSLCVAFVVVLLAVYFVASRMNKHDDSIWKVKREDLHFDDPPEVLGRGTFGLVLLAEYRGTMVAVKRAIPPRAHQKGKSSKHLLTAFDGTVSGSINMNNHGKGLADDSESHASGTKEYGSGSIKISTTGSGMISGAHSNDVVERQIADPNVSHGVSKSLLSSFSTIFVPRKGSKFKTSWSQLQSDFIAEMRYLSTLRHPCITTVMGAVIDRDTDPMLVMEYMDHGSLYDVLHNNTILLEGELLLPIMRDVSQGLRFLHAADPQVIHGDLKAANILVDSKFRAKVADFGLSQKRNIGATGTPYWMAPELLRQESTNTCASDVYSFGMILYEVYSRQDPYEGENSKEVLKQVADKNINKRPPIPSGCPPLVQSLMVDCLLGDANQRPNAEELDIRLKRIDVEHVEPEQQQQQLSKQHQQASSSSSQSKNSSISLFDIFPTKIAEALRDGRTVEAEHRDVVTIFFSDIVGFTNISSSLSPHKVANMLDRLYSKFDALSEKHDIFKVETIGDAYMAVTNLVKDQPDDHAKRIAEFAIDAIEAANETLIDLEDIDGGYVDIRVGFHSGPVVADVVGSRNPRYCLFGDTVNTASRMESNSKKNRIHCSDRAADLLREQCPSIPLVYRGCIEVKGKGEMDTFWVNESNTSKVLVPSPSLIRSNTDDGLAPGDEEVQVSQFVDNVVRNSKEVVTK